MAQYSNGEEFMETEGLLLYLLASKYRFATVEKLAREIGVNECDVRRALLNLKKRGLVDSVALGLLLYFWRGNYFNFESRDPREIIYYATVTLEQLKQMPYVKKLISFEQKEENR
ncbi:MAG: hypothetical protein QXY24_04085 [Candidatus Aenigmatarchaeota archaeon]